MWANILIGFVQLPLEMLRINSYTVHTSVNRYDVQRHEWVTKGCGQIWSHPLLQSNAHACIVYCETDKMLREERSQSYSTFPLMGVVTHFEAMYSLFQGKPVLGSVLHDLLVSDTRIDRTDNSCKAWQTMQAEILMSVKRTSCVHNVMYTGITISTTCN